MPIDQLDNVERYFFLLLYAPDYTEKFTHPIRGRTWLQKEMFLLSKFVPDLEKQAEYNANMMGFFSQIVDEVEDQFYISELVERIGDSLKLSLEGRRTAEEVWRLASEAERRIVTSVKTLLNDLTQLELLGLIYSEYPETAIDSEKRQEVEDRRIDIAVGLLQKGKLPLEKAADIANQSKVEFIRTLEARGISMSDIETKNVLLDHLLLEEIEQSKEESKQGRRSRWEEIRQHH